MTSAPPMRYPALAAAATPVVAAALVLVAVVAGACEPRPHDGRPSPTAARAGSPSASATGGSWPAGWRLVVVSDPMVEPRAIAFGPGPPGTSDEGPVPLVLPPGATALAALAVAADGAVAAVAPDGHAWTLPRGGDLLETAPPWRDLERVTPPGGLPGPVLGATWSSPAGELLLLAGTPGTGARRTVVVRTRLDARTPVAVEIPLEADGPGLAALPDGQVAFVVRDPNDRGALARLAPAGSFVTLPLAARAVTAGGDVLAIVGDVDVRIGSLDELRQGRLPTQTLPLEGRDGVGAVAIAADGSLVAVVRLGDGGAPDRVDVLARDGPSWLAAGTVDLDEEPGSAIVAWVRAP